MPFANNDGIKIYYEVEGQGQQAIVLVHGSTGDTSFWRGYGYVAPLKELFTVILVDARGHGRSDKPHAAAAYAQELMAKDILAVMDAENIDQAHYWGYSMGGYLGFKLAEQTPERFISLIVGGADPYYAPVENEDPNLILQLFQRGVIEGPDALVEGMNSLFGSISPQYEARLRSLDAQAMVACLESAQERGSYGNIITQIHIPCLLYAGEQDGDCYESGQLAVKNMSQASFFSLPGLNHVGASSAVTLIMPHVISFLTSIKA